MLTTFAFALLTFTPQDAPRTLRVGQAETGDVTGTTPTVSTEKLGNITQQARGLRYTLRVPRDGTYTIELHSPLFDAYLVVRDAAGEILAEDDNGLFGLHAQVGITLTADESYTVQACALHRETGPYRLTCVAGEPPSLAPTTKLALEVEDAEQSVRAFETRLGPDHIDTAVMLRVLGDRLRAAGRHDDAEEPYRRVLAIFEKQLGPDDRETGHAVNGLGVLLNELGRYAEAEVLYRRALAIAERVEGPEHLDVLVLLHNLGALHTFQGRYEEAEPLLRRGVAMAEKLLGPDHPQITVNLAGLVRLYQGQGRHAEAERLGRRILAILADHYGAGHPVFVTHLGDLAESLMHLERSAEAEPLVERALEIHEAAAGAEHPFTLKILNNLAAIRHELGRFAAAEPLYRRALDLREKTASPEHPDLAQFAGNLAALLHKQGRHREAEPFFRRALAIGEIAHGPRHPLTAHRLNQLALVEIELGRPDAAWQHLQRALRISHGHLGQLFATGAGEADRLRYVQEARTTLLLLLDLALSTQNDGWRERSYEALLAWKGQVFRSTTRMRQDLAGAMSATQKKVLDELREVQAELSRTASAESIADRTAHRVQIETLVERRNALEATLVRAAREADGPAPARLADLTAQLPRDSVLIDFHVHTSYRSGKSADGERSEVGDWAPKRVSAWIVRPDAGTVTHIDLGPATALEDGVKRFLATTAVSRGLTPAESPPREAALRAALWDPLRPLVGDAQLVIVSPDTFLATLPFETLQEPDGEFLIEKHAFAYLQDALSLIGRSPPRTRSAPRLLGVGAVDYDLRGPEPDGFVAAANTGADDRAPSFGSAWNPLSETRREVDAIERLHKLAFRNATPRELLRDEEATEERIKRSMAGANVVHLATHGFFRPEGLAESPASTELPGLLSGLVCAGANLPRDARHDDGLLTAEEVSWLDLSACDLVVLSACQTGLGRAHGGEGLMSLRRAFRQAGARAVVSSLWKVRDDATRDLMVDFYERLWRKEVSPIEALRGAQRSMLARNRERYGEPLPATWGAFVFAGDWR